MLQNDIKFLGTAGSKSQKFKTTCLQISYDILIDGGNIIESLKEESRFIEHIFLTHSHLDHITDIPYLFDLNFERLKNPIKIYATKETIKHLKENIFNDQIWPDFTKIQLIHSNKMALEYKIIEYDKKYQFEDITLIPIKVNHSEGSCGYIIKKPNLTALFAPDTKESENIIKKIEEFDINHLIIDCSYPKRLETLANKSGHFCTKTLQQELLKIKKEDISIYPIHIKSTHYQEVIDEIQKLKILKNNGRIIKDGEYLINQNFKEYENKKVDFIKLIAKEKDLDTILKTILIEAMKVTRSDGGTIYIKENDHLKFKVVVNQKLNIFASDVDWPAVPLYIDGKENKTNVSALCALTKEVINIEDVYEAKGFNFEGTKVFDQKNNYRSKSMLVIPLVDYDNDVIGVLQLINKNNFFNIQSYTKEDEEEISLYAIYAATAISKNKMIDELENLFMSFVKSISFAINKKSKYGYNHIKNVEKLMKLMIFAINRDKTIFKNKKFTKDEEKELSVAALVHDIGKIIIPDYILDKATRLYGIFDRIFYIEQKFLNAINTLQIELLKTELASLKGEIDVDIKALKKAYKKEIDQLIKEYLFIKKINNPAITLDEKDLDKIKSISKKQFITQYGKISLLEPPEIENLSVKSGNLTKKERQKINDHAKVGYDMLSKLRFPKKFAKIPQIAGFHHEKLNGTGYPFGLKGDQISFEVRLMSICDIFEALTSTDRPYKRAKSLKEAYEIMDKMADNNEIDKTLYEFFKQNGIFETYLDEVKLSSKQEVLSFV